MASWFVRAFISRERSCFHRPPLIRQYTISRHPFPRSVTPRSPRLCPLPSTPCLAASIIGKSLPPYALMSTKTAPEDGVRFFDVVSSLSGLGFGISALIAACTGGKTKPNNPAVEEDEELKIEEVDEETMTQDDRWRDFETWMAKYEKTYQDNAEKKRRFEIFRARQKSLESEISGEHNFRFPLNVFGDLTNEELRKVCPVMSMPIPRDDMESEFIRKVILRIRKVISGLRDW